ncbi:MAG: hypothetical protein LBL30_01760 [Holosporales bacterium]|nr:hypothetical protein [Holosporales bacterium]
MDKISKYAGNPNTELHIKYLVALRAKIVEINQGQGDSGFTDYLSKGFHRLYNGAIGKDVDGADPLRQYPQLLEHIQYIAKDMKRCSHLADKHWFPDCRINAALYAAVHNRMRTDPITKDIMSLVDGIDNERYNIMIESADVLWITNTAGYLLAAGKIDVNRDFIEWMRGATNPDMPQRPMPENIKQAVREVNNSGPYDDEVKRISETVVKIRQIRTPADRRSLIFLDDFVMIYTGNWANVHLPVLLSVIRMHIPLAVC